MGNWLDKAGLTHLKGLLSTKFSTKVDRYTDQPGGKFLQTDNNGNAVWGDAASPTAVASATEDWLDAHISGGSTIAIDDTLTVAGAAGDAKAIGELIVVSDSSESLGETNKIWINDETPTEIEVPTMEEHNVLADAIDIAPTESLGQELLFTEKNNTILEGKMLDILSNLIDALPSDEILYDIYVGLRTENEWLDVIYHEVVERLEEV